MKKKITHYLTILALAFVSLLDAQNLNIISLEKEIIRYNREGKQKISQQKLSDLLYSGNLTKEEEVAVLLCMASTYRSVGDYMMCLNYLDQASGIAKDLPKDNLLKMKLDYEYAYAYFDNTEYEKASRVMKRIAREKYPVAIPEDQSYILMQEGFLFLRNRDFNQAEKKYNEALRIMETANYCNVPIVLIKLMDLYGKKRNLLKAEELYIKSMKIAGSCSILKYETYAAAEMERIYKENNLIAKAYSVSKKVDSLRKIEDLENRVSEMHIIDKKYSERQELLQSKSFFWEKTGALIIAIILICFIGHSFFKSKKLKYQKRKMESVIERMKDDIDSYSQNNNQEKFVNAGASLDNYEQLTERQKELLNLLAEGLTNKEIADKLFITESTVKYHIKNIYAILDLKGRKDFFKKISNF